ncbi:MAG: hypothetical protein C4527_07240 [Candidatus Omnitrophota bacterium]|jgi:hypothetical protein|nr:MAG: hypothetical protein C4527_07240 [Candidatus Omnitrophota bacterium]
MNADQFGQVLEAADQLTLEEQEMLMDILRRRIIERRRKEIAQDILEARHAFEQNNVCPATPDELMREILS